MKTFKQFVNDPDGTGCIERLFSVSADDLINDLAALSAKSIDIKLVGKSNEELAIRMRLADGMPTTPRGS